MHTLCESNQSVGWVKGDGIQSRGSQENVIEGKEQPKESFKTAIVSI